MEFIDADKIGAAGDFFIKIGNNNVALSATFLFLISIIGVIFFRNSHDWYRVFAFIVMVISGSAIIFTVLYPNFFR